MAEVKPNSKETTKQKILINIITNILTHLIMKIKNLLFFAAAASLSFSAFADDLATGEWAFLPTGEPAVVGQTTQDHLFVRDLDYQGAGVASDNQVSFLLGTPQTVWVWLDDDEIYLNDKVQALEPMAINSAGDLYNEITYNSLQCELYLPMSMRMIMTENEDGDEVAYLQGDRMPNTTDFSFSEKAETKVVDGKEYRVYAIVLSNTKAFGSHFSSKNANGYKNNGPLKKDDAPLFGIFIQNDNQDQAEGRVDDMIIANTEFGFREGVAAGWEPNDYRFIYGTGGNNESQRFQLYNRVAMWGSSSVVENLAEKTVSSVKYINVAGMESNVPFEGVNIKVTTYNDGTTSTSKVMK